MTKSTYITAALPRSRDLELYHVQTAKRHKREKPEKAPAKKKPKHASLDCHVLRGAPLFLKISARAAHASERRQARGLATRYIDIYLYMCVRGVGEEKVSPLGWEEMEEEEEAR